MIRLACALIAFVVLAAEARAESATGFWRFGTVTLTLSPVPRAGPRCDAPMVHYDPRPTPGGTSSQVIAVAASQIEFKTPLLATITLPTFNISYIKVNEEPEKASFGGTAYIDLTAPERGNLKFFARGVGFKGVAGEPPLFYPASFALTGYEATTENQYLNVKFRFRAEIPSAHCYIHVEGKFIR
ncbi:hypothetical protein [Methylopila turkensis]|uniref:Uncharacterized protein n=1 Tax=Methylopila turkensis TaxID=1437816 RepID=A0A9W6JP72_9HYPH|nr:hypothetical protein [Methylopila turkensis]GLK79848.1 hypothetical protein GCM10008174_15890 [Methylopila turkensis]